MFKKSTLFIADSRKLNNFIPKESVDLVITNPPYWNEVVYSHQEGQLSQINDYKLFLNEVSKVWASCSLVLKPGGILALWVHDFFRKDQDGSFTYIPFHGDLIKSMPDNLALRHIGIWDRYLHKDRGPLDVSEKISTRFEYVLIFQKQGIHTQNNDLIKKSLRDLYWNPIWNYKTHPKLAGSRTLFRVLFELQRMLPLSGFLRETVKKTMVTDNYEFTHYTTECPEEIAVRFIQKFTRPGDNILDPFLGSGTTMKVARQLDRYCTGVEINKEALPSIKKKTGFSPEVTFVP